MARDEQVVFAFLRVEVLFAPFLQARTKSLQIGPFDLFDPFVGVFARDAVTRDDLPLFLRERCERQKQDEDPWKMSLDHDLIV